MSGIDCQGRAEIKRNVKQEVKSRKRKLLCFSLLASAFRLIAMLRTHTLIIGGGPAGSTAARFSAAGGVETLLVERDPSYVKPCGGGIPSSAFDELQIPKSLAKKEIRNLTIVSPKGEKLDFVLSGGSLCIAERGDFDKKLRELAEEKGAAVMEGEFIRFEQTGKNLISIIRKRKTSEEIKIKSDYVIASDGITSRVGSAVKSPRQGSLYTLSVRIKPALHSGTGISPLTLDSACEFWFGSEHAKNFYSWYFPSQGYASMGTGSANPKDLMPLLDRFIIRKFGVPLKSFAEENFSGRTRAFKMPEWSGKLYNIKNILFIGDAAGMVMPVTYEGIYYAMKSGEFAARAIMEGKPGSYKKIWKDRFYRRFFLMSKIKKHIFKSDENIEKWVSFHKSPEVQEIAIRLWLRKEPGNKNLFSYINALRHIIKI